VATNSSALDSKSDARLGSQAAADGEHKASVSSAGIPTDPAATPAQQAPLPTNRTKKELDDYRKRMEDTVKVQKKAYDAMVKRCAKTPTAAGCATPASATPEAPPPAGATPMGGVAPVAPPVSQTPNSIH
jgi:hypothetical protein